MQDLKSSGQNPQSLENAFGLSYRKDCCSERTFRVNEYFVHNYDPKRLLGGVPGNSRLSLPHGYVTFGIKRAVGITRLTPSCSKINFACLISSINCPHVLTVIIAEECPAYTNVYKLNSSDVDSYIPRRSHSKGNHWNDDSKNSLSSTKI